MSSKIFFLLLVICYCSANLYTVQMTVNVPNVKPLVVSLPWYPSQTLLDAMIQSVTYTNQQFTFAIAFESAQYGGFITTICGVPSNNSVYWLFTVNNQQAQVGVGQYQLNMGDQVVWNYASA